MFPNLPFVFLSPSCSAHANGSRTLSFSDSYLHCNISKTRFYFTLFVLSLFFFRFELPTQNSSFLLLCIKIHEWYFVVFHVMTNAVCSDVVTFILSPWIDLTDTLQSRYFRLSLLCFSVGMIDRPAPHPTPIKTVDGILCEAGEVILNPYFLSLQVTAWQNISVNMTNQ